VNRDSGTASANGGWLRRLVRPQNRHISKLLGKHLSVSFIIGYFLRLRQRIAAPQMNMSKTAPPELEPDKAASNVFIKCALVA
jgi:hypothetical protein